MRNTHNGGEKEVCYWLDGQKKKQDQISGDV